MKKKSKMQIACDKAIKKDYILFYNYDFTMEHGEHIARDYFEKGAKALLRYAKRKGGVAKFFCGHNAFVEKAVSVKDLEKWVKGEKAKGER